MAENIQLNSGSGGDLISAHDLGSSVKMQRFIQSGVQSTDNTTTTPLSSAATYTGTWEQNSYQDVMVSCQTDNGGTLYFDFSPDGTNNNSFPVGGFTVASGVHEFHIAVKGPRHFRVRLVNDSGAQSYLRLYTYFGTFRQGNLPLSSTISNDSDASIVRSVLVGADSDGNYLNVRANKGEALLVSDFGSEVALGNITGYQIDTKFGRNSDIDTGTAEDMWEGGGVYTGQPVSFTPETVDVVSSSTDDAAAGTGARTLRIFGLKTSSSTSYESEDITLNGTTDVTSSSSWWRINRAYVLTAGSGGGNAGVITINSTTTTANVFCSIPVGVNQTQIAAYTVPSGMTVLIKRILEDLNV